jgi:DNA-binding SARP family transcriptional activator
LSTRTPNPPPSLARHRLHQRVEVLAWDDLRFAVGEAGRLIRASAPGRWSRDHVRAVHASTDGWGAGLVLLATHESLGVAARTRMRSRSVDVLFDYFATEIFNKTTTRTQNVLLQTAFLPWLTAAMAEALTGSGDAGEVIQYLHRQNYFTNRRLATESVFEYHPLFRTFLLSKARQSFTDTELVDLRCRAAHLAEQADLVDAAVDLLRDAEAWPKLASLIGRHAPPMLAQGRGDSVERWLAQLPSSVMEHSSWLLYWRGMCRFAWRHAESQADLKEAFVQFRDDCDATGAYLSWSAIIIAFEAESNLMAVDSWLAEFERLRTRFGTIPSEDVERRVASAVLAVSLHRYPRHPEAPRWAARALELSRSDADLGLRAISAFNWWLYHFQLGQHTNAAPVDEMRALMDARDTAPEVAVMASLLPIWSEALTGDVAYRATTGRMLALARSTGMFNVARFGALVGALMGALSDGELELASSWASEYEKESATLGNGYRGIYSKFLVRTALQRDDLATAALHRSDMVTYSVAAGWKMDMVAGFLLSAQVLDRCGDRQRAHADLGQAKQIACDIDSPYVDFMVQLAEAELALNAGDQPRGVQALRSAMKLGAAGEFVNTPVWQPQSMSRLCAFALEAGIEVEYSRRLIGKRQLTAHPLDADNEAWPWPIKICTLGRFEVLVRGNPITFPVKAQRKPVGLLKALIASGADRVREERLVDLLWPDASGDAGAFALTTTLHRLRNLLGHADAILRQDGQISLNSRLCWVDALTMLRLLERASSLRSDSDQSWDQLRTLTKRIEQLYAGSFLTGEDNSASWVRSIRDKLETKLITHLLRVGMLAERRGLWDDAADVYEIGVKADPCAEALCRCLMACYSRLGRQSDVQRTYERCRDALATSWDALPSDETRFLWNQLRTV